MNHLLSVDADHPLGSSLFFELPDSHHIDDADLESAVHSATREFPRSPEMSAEYWNFLVRRRVKRVLASAIHMKRGTLPVGWTVLLQQKLHLAALEADPEGRLVYEDYCEARDEATRICMDDENFVLRNGHRHIQYPDDPKYVALFREHLRKKLKNLPLQ